MAEITKVTIDLSEEIETLSNDEAAALIDVLLHTEAKGQPAPVNIFEESKYHVTKKARQSGKLHLLNKAKARSALLAAGKLKQVKEGIVLGDEIAGKIQRKKALA